MITIARYLRIAIAALLSTAAVTAHADSVTDWNARAADLVAASGLNPPAANRALAIAQAAVFDAVNAITRRYATTGRPPLSAAPDASVDAAVTAAMHGTLGKLCPTQQPAIEAAYQSAFAALPDGPARRAGISVGEQAAAAVLALRSADGAIAADDYVPSTMPGVYVPTTTPAVPHWGQRKPWVLVAGNQFRPGPPPALSSELWARDYNEIKAIGSRNSATRSAAQTEIARFWEATQPVIYYPLARAVALQPGRELTQNARLLAAVSMAMDDALIAVFDAKYAFGFWRPITAIRNGDKDGNDATEGDPTWTPFIDTPMHPEYPCAHCVVSAALGAVLQAEIGSGPVPPLASTSPTAPGVRRSWASVAEFVQEVANARVYDGVHFRHSTEVGSAMGRRIGELVAARALR
jgi:hypothetical protein